MRWLIDLVSLVAACDAPCDLEELAACPGCGPGEIRGGVSGPIGDVIDQPPPAVSVTNGFACVVCDELVRFDTRGAEQDAVALDDPTRTAIAPDGSIYELQSYQPPRRSDGYPPTSRWRLIAYDPSGRERWRTDLEQHAKPRELAADDAGPYVADDLAFQPRVIAYDAATGAARWTDTGSLAVPDGAGGVFLMVRNVSGVETATLTITAFDAAHVARWNRTFTARAGAPSHVEVREVRVTADGIALVGRYSGTTLDLGGLTLSSTPSELYIGFVASLDPQGAPRWAHAFGGDNFLSELSVTVAGGQIVVGGRYVGEGGPLALPATGNGELGDNGFLATFDAQGLQRVHAFTGDGFQGVRSVVDAGDGSVWATLDTRGGFTLGAATYPGDDSPRRYLINVAP